MNRLKKRKTKLLWAGMLFGAILLGGQEVWSKIYSVQIGFFQKFENAQKQFNLLKKSLPSNLSNHLRIEKTGKDYAIKVGKFDDLEQALTLLSDLKDHSPDAFIKQGDWIPKNIVEIEKSPASLAEDQSMEGKVPHAENKKNEPSGKTEIPLHTNTNQAMLIGTIREVSPLASEQLGMPSGKIIYRLIVQVEATKEIKGGPDFIKEREGELLTVFSETNPPIFRPGNKITAVVEYRGNRFSRFYWINKPQAANP
jgi:hypothetical protein